VEEFPDWVDLIALGVLLTQHFRRDPPRLILREQFGRSAGPRLRALTIG
jgi:hypothetical protein